MANDTVLIATAGMANEIRKAVEAACRLAAVSSIGWSQEPQGAWPVVPNPALVVGVLPRSERRIPDALAFTVSQAFPGLPMLLLCEEQLTRDLVVLNDRRISLLSPPVTPEQLAHQIRRNLASRGVPPGPLFGRQHTRVHRGTNWWLAGLSRHRYLREFTSPVTFPWMEYDATQPRPTAILPAGPGGPTSEELAAWAGRVANLRNHTDAVHESPSWCSSAAALHVDWEAGKGVLLGPAEGASAWVFSPFRMPNVFRVGGPAGAEMAVIQPAFGDLVVLLSRSSDGVWPDDLFEKDHPEPALEAAMQGGNVLLGFLQETLVQAPGDHAAVLFEVL